MELEKNLSASETRKAASAAGLATRYRAAGNVVWLPVGVLRARLQCVRANAGVAPLAWCDVETAEPSEQEARAMLLEDMPELFGKALGGDNRGKRTPADYSPDEGKGNDGSEGEGDGKGEGEAEAEGNGKGEGEGEREAPGDDASAAAKQKQAREQVDVEHEKADEIRALLELGETTMLVGPAGSGKTTAARQAGAALGLSVTVVSLSGGATEGQLLGSVRPSDGEAGVWRYHATPLSMAIEAADSLIVLDELDAADPNTLVSIHGLLDVQSSDVYIPSRGKAVRKGRNLRVIATANTFGDGSGDYVGRNPIDLATLDRFAGAVIVVPYSARIEGALIANALGCKRNDKRTKSVLSYFGKARAAIEKGKLRRVVSTRLVKAALASLVASECACDVMLRHFATFSDSERARLQAGGLQHGRDETHEALCVPAFAVKGESESEKGGEA